MDFQEIQALIEKQKSFFATGKTKKLEFRIKQLQKLKHLIANNWEEIVDCIKKDIGRNEIEGYVFDILPVLKECDLFIKNLKKWAKPQKVQSALGTSSYIFSEPYGSVLILSPWNYPFFLALLPAVGAIAAGNTVILKPSELSPHTSSYIKEMIVNNFPQEEFAIVEGDADSAKYLTAQKFDYIFFTGSPKIGKVVYETAARNLIPVTLELGGKSPCIVDENSDFEKAVKRIVWGKTINGGQTCIAPDYLLINEKVKTKFVEKFNYYVKEFFGENPKESKFYTRIANKKSFDRLVSLMQQGDIIAGGTTDENDLYIAPTLIDNIDCSDEIMQEEIFGPVLPVLTYTEIQEAIDFINLHPKPLALYIFSNDKKFVNKILKSTSSGGVCINDTILHASSKNMPFGGVGNSGIGAYIGEYSFKTFSHQKSVLKNSSIIDRDFLYPPYKIFSFKMLRYIVNKML